MKDNLTFEQLPQAISDLIQEVNELKQLFIDQEKQTKPEPIEQLLNIQEAAKLLDLTVPTMYSKVSRGDLPVMKKGKRLYFSYTELMEYLKSGKKKSNAEIEAEAEEYINSYSR